MRLEGIHHISSITGDAAGNVRFYAGVLGLRMVKKTINQDDPSVYHLFYADDAGSPGADMTFFEYPGARPGRAGAGMIHRILLRVGSTDALAFWSARLAAAGIDSELGESTLRFGDPEGLGLELVIDDVADAPLTASHPEIPAEHAILGFSGVRAYAADPARSARVLADTYGFTPTSDDGTRWEVRGDLRGGTYAYDPAPVEHGVPGAGTVHHVAWAVHDDDYHAWNQRLLDAGLQTSGEVDRFYFQSIYHREPSGVLFELATLGPGFTADQAPEDLGVGLALPPRFEPYREQIEAALTPLPDAAELLA